MVPIFSRQKGGQVQKLGRLPRPAAPSTGYVDHAPVEFSSNSTTINIPITIFTVQWDVTASAVCARRDAPADKNPFLFSVSNIPRSIPLRHAQPEPPANAMMPSQPLPQAEPPAKGSTFKHGARAWTGVAAVSPAALAGLKALCVLLEQPDGRRHSGARNERAGCCRTCWPSRHGPRSGPVPQHQVPAGADPRAPAAAGAAHSQPKTLDLESPVNVRFSSKFPYRP